MSAHWRERVAPYLENVTESGTACLLAMVQGNVFALTAAHWVIASRTGVLSGTIATAALAATRHRNPKAVALVLGAATVVADYLSHPSHFGGRVAEALVTGVVAGALAALVGSVRKSVRRRRSVTAAE